MNKVLKNSYSNGLTIIPFRNVLGVDGDIYQDNKKIKISVYLMGTNNISIVLLDAEAKMFISQYNMFLKREEIFIDEARLY